MAVPGSERKTDRAVSLLPAPPPHAPALPPLDSGRTPRPALSGGRHHSSNSRGDAPQALATRPGAPCPGRPWPQLAVLTTPDGAQPLPRGRGLALTPGIRGHLARPAREEDAGHIAALEAPATGDSLVTRGRVKRERRTPAPVPDTPVSLCQTEWIRISTTKTL